MATGTFTDSTSSNGMKDNWVAKISYTTTQYEGYTMVEATLKLTTTYNWSAVLNNGYSLTINGDKVTGSGKSVVSNGTVTLLTHKVKITHTTNKEITISASVNASNIYYNSGGYYIGTYNPSGSVTLKPLPTKCVAPTSFSVSPSPFMTSVTLSWSGAKGGTANAIKGYYIKYFTSSNNSNWSEQGKLTTVDSTAASGSVTIDMSSKVTNNHYVKFQIRTLGKAGEDYYSSYKESSSVLRQSYTACSAPTKFIVTPDDNSVDGFNTTLTFEWDGASGGTNNEITKYLIRYCVSSNNSTWGDWKDLPSISSTKASGKISINLSSHNITRGQYLKFSIKTQGRINGYDSTDIYANNATNLSNATIFRRNPYTACTAPTSVTITSEADVSGVKHNNVFNSNITIAWSVGGAGENNAIKRYYIEYCTSSNNSTWGAWTTLQSSDLTPVGTSSTTVDVSSMINRGAYMKIRIRTEGVVMTKGADGNYLYYSKFIESTSIRRNSIPNAPTIFTISSHSTLEFSKGEDIKLQWDKPIDINDNIFRYRIQYAIGSKNNVSNNIINNNWSNLATIDNKNTLEWTISATNSLFEQIENYQSDNSNSLIQFRIQVVDIFQEYNNGDNSYYTYSPIVTRYDMTGVAIGINGKWVNCQIYVGTNGSWIEQDVSVGIYPPLTFNLSNNPPLVVQSEDLTSGRYVINSIDVEENAEYLRANTNRNIDFVFTYAKYSNDIINALKINSYFDVVVTSNNITSFMMTSVDKNTNAQWIETDKG